MQSDVHGAIAYSLMPAVCKTKGRSCLFRATSKLLSNINTGITELFHCKKKRPGPGWAGFPRGEGWGSEYASQNPAVAFRCCYSSSLTVHRTLENFPWWIPTLQIQRNNQNTMSAYDQLSSCVSLVPAAWIQSGHIQPGDWRWHCTLWHTPYILGWVWLPFISIPLPLHLSKAAPFTSLQQEIKTRGFSESSTQGGRLRENTTKDEQNFTRVLLRLSLRREGSGENSLQLSST